MLNKSPDRHFCILLCAIPLFLTSCDRNRKQAEQRAYTPQESLAAIKVSEDFIVELFLTEHQVNSPVEMDFDEKGESTWPRCSSLDHKYQGHYA